MNLLFNAANLRSGGGLSVALSLMNQFIAKYPNHTYFILVPKHSEYQKLTQFENVQLIEVPSNYHNNFIVKIKFNNSIIIRLCKKHNIHKIISLGNVALPCKGIPQLVLIALPHLAYPESIAWKMMPLKTFFSNKLMVKYVRYYMKYASKILVQTHVMQQRFQRLYTLPNHKIGILPNAPNEEQAFKAVLAKNLHSPLQLFFLSKYYYHKNFEILIPVLLELKLRNLAVTFTIPMRIGEHHDFDLFYQKIKELNLEKSITLIGNLSPNEVGNTLLHCDAVFLPTLLESYSGAYLEAFKYAKPILTSDLDFAHESCSDAAYYFQPLSATSIVDEINKCMLDSELFKLKSQAALENYNQLPSWDMIAEYLFDYLNEIN